MRAAGVDSPVETIVSVRDLRKHFPLHTGVFQRVSGHVKSVDGVSFDIRRGETLGLVGESGCGKTTLGRCVAGLISPTDGGVFYGLNGEAIGELDRLSSFHPDVGSGKEAEEFFRKYRVGSMSSQYRDLYRRNCQIVFQDTHASLNPRSTVRDIVGRPIRLHEGLSNIEITERVVELLESVGLGAAHLYRYPHQFSGGQRQRISIARAIACRPQLVVLDEPTSSLDVSVQAQILNLLTDLQRDLGLTYLFISHDLNVVQHMSDRVVVMYLGKIAEIGNSNDLFDEPKHPYTEALIAANPTTANLTRSRIRLRGTVPSPARPPQGCGFHTRCPRAFGDCGWEARDVLDLLRRDDRFAEADIELEATSPFQGTLTFATDSLAGLAAAHLAEEETSPAWLRDALVGLEIDAAKMTVTLKDAGPVELLALGPSRSTSCLLYASEPQ